MAIFTRFGSKVKILAGNMETGQVRIQFENGDKMDAHISELKADDGLNEIEKAILGYGIKVSFPFKMFEYSKPFVIHDTHIHSPVCSFCGKIMDSVDKYQDVIEQEDDLGTSGIICCNDKTCMKKMDLILRLWAF